MRVQFTRAVASPTLAARPGQIVDLPDVQAQQRIDAGHAVAVGQPKPRLRDRLPGRRRTEPRTSAKESTVSQTRDGAGDGKALEKLTVDQLKEYADERDISLPDGGRKADLVAAIVAALSAGE
ncbi:SAP domain-containing protein [Streptomyces sp. STCH 565 A]|uniref:SAP domain-containing protein n=1 Tax=Streptomyces sp. STCH 565 A TaxID=2950532 RepID=UPI002075BE8B|nr:SAP domain-containing protein [Streptomyces sp. STCH 565 A]MCM8550063.1 SAP domain-containing protein [Streptomyces sp. STCH 565 A]